MSVNVLDAEQQTYAEKVSHNGSELGDGDKDGGIDRRHDDLGRLANKGVHLNDGSSDGDLDVRNDRDEDLDRAVLRLDEG